MWENVAKKYHFILIFLFFFSNRYKSSVVTSGIIVLAAAALTLMDYVTWKRSENYKGKRASFAVSIHSTHPEQCLFFSRLRHPTIEFLFKNLLFAFL